MAARKRSGKGRRGYTHTHTRTRTHLLQEKAELMYIYVYIGCPTNTSWLHTTSQQSLQQWASETLRYVSTNTPPPDDVFAIFTTVGFGDIAVSLHCISKVRT